MAERLKAIGEIMNCIHCNREINNKGSLKAHEIVCKKNPDRKKYVRSPKAGRQLGKIKVDGTWELEVAKYLDSIGVEWKRNKKRFQYINMNGNISTYQPDFVIQYRYYIEVKGYETDLDRCKWSQFQEHLTIFKKEQIDFIKSGGKPDGVWASLLS